MPTREQFEKKLEDYTESRVNLVRQLQDALAQTRQLETVIKQLEANISAHNGAIEDAQYWVEEFKKEAAEGPKVRLIKGAALKADEGTQTDPPPEGEVS